MSQDNYGLHFSNRPLRELHLFAGAGGGILGGMLLGHTCVCAVEIEPYCRESLLQRQRDGILPKFPIWDDVRTFDGRPWKGSISCLHAGFPCQRYSQIGKVQGSDGFDGWPDTCRILGEVGAPLALLENVPAILNSPGCWGSACSQWGLILGDLARMGYDVRWGVFRTTDAQEDAPIDNKRLFALASSVRLRLEAEEFELAKPFQAWKPSLPSATNGTAWDAGIPEPTVERIPDVLANYMGELSAIGNGQVPAVVKLAWETLSQ